MAHAHGPELVAAWRRDIVAAWRRACALDAEAPVTGPQVISVWRQRFATDVAEVPSTAIRALEHVVDEALLTARARGNTPRQPIAEDGKRGGKGTPKR